MIMLQPAAAAGASAKEGPTPPPFHTPRPFVKSEPSATPHDSAGHMGGAGQGSAQLGQPGSHHRRQLQTSTGFDLAARQSLEQRSKTEGARPRPADAFAQVASLSQAAGPGLSFSVPRPPPGSFPGVDPTLKGLREQGLRTELERTDKGTHAQAAEQSSPAEDEEQQDPHSMAPQVVSKPTDASMQGLESASLLSAAMPPVSNTDPSSVDTEASGAAAQGSANVVSPSADSDELQTSKAVAGNAQADAVVAGSVSVAEVQREAALAAAKDAQDAEHFAAQALQSPRLQSSPASKVSLQQLCTQNSMQQLCTTQHATVVHNTACNSCVHKTSCFVLGVLACNIVHSSLQSWQGCFSLLQALCITAFCTILQQA